MRVSATDEIGHYAMFRSKFVDQSVTTAVTNVFWFPDQEVSAGDFVVLYSKRGVSNTKTNKDGTKSHFFYWGSDKVLWKGGDYSAVLLHVAAWRSFNPSSD